MKIETGVMVMKEGKAWGVVHKDGASTCYGWIAPEDAEIHNQQFCKQPTDVTYKGSHYENELRTGKIVKVKRHTKVIYDENQSANTEK